MAAEGVDVSFIQDEDVLRRMWQQTQDFSRKKEIRARMYKLREQRLKEFYTTGEVLSDVRDVTPLIEDDSPRFAPEVIHKSARYTTSAGQTMTHADSIKDQDFLAMKSKEIRDSESPTRDLQVFRRNNENGGQSYWKVESSSGRYQAVGSGEQVEISSQSQQQKIAGENDKIISAKAVSSQNKSVIDKSGEVKTISSHETSYSGADAIQTRAQVSHQEESTKSEIDAESSRKAAADNKTAVSSVSKTLEGGNVVSSNSAKVSEEKRVTSSTRVQQSSVSQKWSSSSSSSSTSKIVTGSTVTSGAVIIDGGRHVTRVTGDSSQNKSIEDVQAGNSRTSASETRRESKSESHSTSSHKEQRSSSVEQKATVVDSSQDVQSKDLKAITSADTTVKGSEVITADVSVKSTERTQQRISQSVSEASQVSTDNVEKSARTTEAVAAQGTKSENVNVSKLKKSEKDIIKVAETRAIEVLDQTRRETKTPERRADTSPARSPGRRTTPFTTEKPERSVMKKPSEELQLEKGDVDYTTTYKSAFTPKRISVDVSATHAAFASSLRAPSLSPERSVSPVKSTTATDYHSPERRSPTKSIDRSTPTSKRSSHPEPPSKGPTRESPKRYSTKSPSPTKNTSNRAGSPEKTASRSVIKDNRKISERRSDTTAESTTKKVTDRSKEKRKLSSYSSRAATKKRSGTPGVSPSASPTDLSKKTERGRSRTTSSSSTSTLTDGETNTQKVTEVKKEADDKYQQVTNLIDSEKTDTTRVESREEVVKSSQNVDVKDKLEVSLATRLREKSPEYSSDGSLIQELYPVKVPGQVPKENSVKSSPSSSPDRKGFTPIEPSEVSQDSSVSPDEKKVTAPAPSPASPIKKVNGLVTDSDDTDDVGTRREKVKPGKSVTQRPKSPIPRKSYSSRSSSISPYSSPERKISSLGGSPNRERFPSSSPASSPERRKTPVKQRKSPARSVSPRKEKPSPKKELTEYPSQRRFPEKDKKPVSAPTKAKPTVRPISVPKAPVTPTKSSPRAALTPRSPITKKPITDRKPSDKKLTSPTVPITKTTLDHKKSDKLLPSKPTPQPSRTTAPRKPIEQPQRKPDVPKARITPQKNISQTPQAKKPPSSVDAGTPRKTQISSGTNKSAFVRTDSSKKQNLAVVRLSTDNKRRSSQDRTERYGSLLKNQNNKTGDFIRSEIRSEVKQKQTTRKNIIDFEWDKDKPPSEFKVDDSSRSSQENIAPVGVSQPQKKSTQSRTSSGPILKTRDQKKATTEKTLLHQRSEPKLRVSQADSLRQKTTQAKQTSKTELVTRKRDDAPRTKATQGVSTETKQTKLCSRRSKENVTTQEVKEQRSVTVIRGLTTVTVSEEQKSKKTRRASKEKVKKSEESSSSSQESEDEVDKEAPVVVTNKGIYNEQDSQYIQQLDEIRKTEELNYANKVTSNTIQDFHRLQATTGNVDFSSRESSRSPDGRPVKFTPVSDTEVEELRPRYADRVSEPDDDSDVEFRRRTPQKSLIRPDVVLEEEEEPKETLPKAPLKTILKNRNQELVTDLDETETVEDDVDEIKINVSVAERVNQFMESSRLSATSPPPSRPEDITLKGLDDTINEYLETNEYGEKIDVSDQSLESVNAVLKAKSMFETIANNQASTVSKTAKRELLREDDIVSRPSVFQARKAERQDTESIQEALEIEKEEETTEEITEVKKPIGKIDIQAFTPKPVHPKVNGIDYNRPIGKVNVAKFESPTKSPKKDEGRGTLPRRKTPSPERNVGKFDTFPSRKGSRPNGLDLGRRSQSPEKVDASPQRNKITSRGEPPEKVVNRKSPTKEVPDEPRRPSIPEGVTPTQSVMNRYPLARQDSGPGQDRKQSPPSKVPLSPDYEPSGITLKEKPTKIPEDSALKTPALLKRQSSPDRKRPSIDVEVSPKRRGSKQSPERSPTRKESLPNNTEDVSLTRRDSLQKTTTTEQVKISKFGVALRRTSSGSGVGRRSSADVGKKETDIEKIFDLELLESMLEKAHGYEERRLIRGQIRIVKKILENNESTRKITSEVTRDAKERNVRSRSKSPQKNQSESARTTQNATVTVRVVSREEHERRSKSPEKKIITERKVEKSTRRSESPERNNVQSYQRMDVETRRKFSEKSSDNARKSTELTADSSKKTTPRQTSKTEIHINLAPVSNKSSFTVNTVNKTIRKSHVENETKEGNLTDSITSSYGVGPTDDKGRPLFGLKALRRQNTGNAVETETVRISTQETETSQEIKDSSGRALFGLKALKISKNSVNKGEIMPSLEQPDCPQLKDLVSKHEKHAKGNAVSQPRQRPPARLRDNFIQAQNQQNQELIQKETEAEEVNRLIKDRGQSLRAMIQRHESLTEADQKEPRTVSTSSSFTTSTVVKSSAVRRSDGTVSVKKQVIQGESVSKNGEEPVTRVRTAEYSYQTPENEKSSVAITELPSDVDTNIVDGSSIRRRSSKTVTSRSSTSDSIHSRTSSISSKSARKSPSPDRKSTDRFSSTSSTHVLSRTEESSGQRSKDKTDTRTQNSRRPISDKLSQLSKKFSSDSIDGSAQRSSVAERRESQSSVSSSSQKRSSIVQSTTENTSSSRRFSSSQESEAEVTSNRRQSTSPLDDLSDVTIHRRSSTPLDDVKENLFRKTSTAKEDNEYASFSLSRVAKGGAVKALSQKFQQVAEAESPKTGATYPKAGLILRTASFKHTNGDLTLPDTPGLQQSTSMEVRVGSPTRSGTSTPRPDQEQKSFLSNERETEIRNETNRSWSRGDGETCERRVTRTVTSESVTDGGNAESKSFIGNTTRVSGVQDLITRMRAADSENVAGETVEDSEARALLNKFLGASVMMSGMEPLVKASGASSATLVSQVERQRILHSTPSKTSVKDHVTSTVKDNRKGSENIEEIWDERKLRQLLDACTDYDGRRKLRARLRTVMAEKSVCEEIVAAAREEEESNKSESGEVTKNVHQQGESLLPYLVEQLRTSLMLEPRSYSSQSSEEGTSVPHVEDSGTESGEDLRLLVGLRDSIYDGQDCKKDESAGPGLLAEVQSALVKLQTSINTGLASDACLDETTRDTLLQLVSRLQSSLKLPTSDAKPLAESKSANKNRFATRRLLRQNRHTVGVTREELADARRLLEETALKDRLSLDLRDAKQNIERQSANICDEKSEDLRHDASLPPTPYAVLKQSSAGDLMSAPSTLNPTPLKSFRPVHFTPLKSKAPTTLTNTIAKPFLPSSEYLDGRVRNPLENMRRQSEGSNLSYLQTLPLPELRDVGIGEPATDVSPIGFVEVPVEVKVYEKPRVVTAISHSSKSPPKKSNIKRSECFSDPVTESITSRTPSSPPQRNMQYVPNVYVNQEQSQPYSQLHDAVKPYGNVTVEKLAKDSDSRSSSRGSVEKELPPLPPLPSPVRQPLLHSKSLIEKTYEVQSYPHPPVTQSLSVDSGSSLLEYDPSLRLFTPEQSVKIAVHKAAINKQLSQEEAKRARKMSVESDLVSSDDEAVEEDGDVSSETEEEESTVKQTRVTKYQDATDVNGYATQPNYNDSGMNELDLHKSNITADDKVLTNHKFETVKEKGRDLVKNFQKLSENFSFLKNFKNENKEQNNYMKDANRFEKRIQEIQNERKIQNRQNVRSIDELQKIYNDRKEKDMERKNSNESRSQMIQSAQAKYQKNLANQAISSKTFTHQRHQLNPDIRSKYEFEMRKNEENLDVKHRPLWMDHENKEPEPEYALEPEIPMDVSQTESEMSLSSTSTENSISHAQKLLQLATNDKPTRFYARNSKKLKMKRANTIDIPKPLNFYQVEDDTDYSEDEHKPMEHDQMGLKGPVSVGSKTTNTKMPPILKPKTESDKKFLAFLGQQNQPKVTQAIWKKDQEQKAPVAVFRNPKTTEHQWGNRFSRIKTAFEGPEEKKNDAKNQPAANMSNARAFWKTADDSAAVVKSNKNNISAANGARLSRQGSMFLKKLFEQKEAEEKTPGKLPWTSVPNENVVVGSLTVCRRPPDNGRKVFSPNENIIRPVATNASSSSKLNQFSHAPMSAFRPVERKIEYQPPKTNTNVISNFQDAKMPMSPPLPWIKDHTEKTLNSTVAKFETFSARDESPLTVLSPRPKTQEKASPPVYHPSPPRPMTRSPSQSSLVQARSQTFTPNYPNVTVNVLKSDLLIPTPPLLSAPNLVQNYSSTKDCAPRTEPFNSVTTYSVDVAATTTVYPNVEDILDLNDLTPSTPEEHIAVAKVMGCPVQQQAVTIKQKTHRRSEEEEGRTSAARNLTSVLQRFSTPTEDRDSESPKAPPVPVLVPLAPRASLPDITVTRTSLLPPNLPKGKTSPIPSNPYTSVSPGGIFRTSEDVPQQKLSNFVPSQTSNNARALKQLYLDRQIPSASSRRTSSAESLVTTTSSEELRENGESVLTTRLQIPVYTTSGQYRASSMQDLSPNHSPSESPCNASVSPPASLRKSESWHQLNGQIKQKRPQSLVLPDLPTPQRRTPTSLVKTKSSHALGFAKQFEAVMTPASVGTKQKTVEEYFSVKKSATKTKKSSKTVEPELVELDDNLENVDEAFDALFNSSVASGSSSAKKIKKKPSDLKISNSATTQNRTSVSHISKSTSATSIQIRNTDAASTVTTKSTDGGITKTEVSTKSSSYSASTSTRISQAGSTNKPVSPFAKFQQLDRQNSGSSSPSSPRVGNAPLFTFTDPKLSRSASGVKDRLLYWCQVKTKNYKNIQIENFSTSWSNGLAFCALIHHFLPESFDYDALTPKERRKNFELAFKVAEDEAGIAPLLDVEDMVMMRKPDWKCVFTYVQSIYRRFKDED